MGGYHTFAGTTKWDVNILIVCNKNGLEKARDIGAFNNFKSELTAVLQETFGFEQVNEN